MAVAAVLVVLACLVPLAPAFAQGEGEVGIEDDEFFEDELLIPVPVDQLVELPGSCPIAAPIEPGNGIDCFFDILPAADMDLLQFANVQVDGDFSSCFVESNSTSVQRLVCPDLLKDRFDEGSVELTLQIEGEVAEAAATITTVWRSDQSFSLFAAGTGEIVVFDGRPLAWFSYAYQPVDGLFLTIRARNGVEIIDTLEIEVVGDAFASEEGSAVPDLPAGRYRMWPCVGPSAASCEEQPGGQPFQVIGAEPLELIPGHNRSSADRINVLFVSSGLERLSDGNSATRLPALARTMLTIDGPLGDDFNGNVVPADELAPRLLWGPMAIEPLASHLDRFNFWYLADEVADEEGVLFGGFERAGDAGFDLPNLHITALYNDGTDFASDARGTSFESFEAGDVPARGRIRFGDARVWVPEFDELGGVTTLAHEWGHGLFGLRDEYYGFDERGITAGYPNCAPDLETAEAWWGDLVGETDPFAAEVVEIRNERLESRYGFRDDLTDRTAIEITAGGCYSDFESTEVYRPSADSLMNSEVPVFGVVNRRRVQEVLDRFSGRGPMATLGDMTLSCEALTGFVTCRGELQTYLDRPLSIVAINSIPCEFGKGRPLAGGEVGPVPVTCTTIAPPSDPVELTFKAERATLEVVDVNPPPPPVPMQSRIIPVEEETTELTGVGTGRTVAIGALLCVAAVALAFVERRRRSGESDD